jgi:hypothetical protein
MTILEEKVDLLDHKVGLLDEKADLVQDAIAETFTHTTGELTATSQNHERRIRRLEHRTIWRLFH